MTHGTVDALIQAAGDGRRMGGQPKAFIRLGSETVVESCVRPMLGVARRVVVAVGGGEVSRTRDLLIDPRISVIAGGPTRTESTRRLIEASDAEWIVLHDVAHPFVTEDLTRRVLDVARSTDTAAVASLPLVEYVYDPQGRLRAAPHELLTSQKPFVARRDAFIRAFRRIDEGATPQHAGEFSAPSLVALAGVRTTLVDGDRRNIKLTFPEDLELARSMVGTFLEMASTDRPG